MSFLGGLINAKSVNHERTIEKLVTEASPRRTFMLMIIISSVIAALGLLNESTSVVIGAMLVAPLLWPILGIGMGIVVGDLNMIRLSLMSIIIAVGISIVTAMLITFQYIPLGTDNLFLQQSDFGFMIPVAIASGIAAALAISFEEIGESIPGIAVSVALIPPLVTVGIGLGGTDWGIMRSSLELFSLNLVGIILASMLVFYLLGFRKYARTLRTAIKKEEKALKEKK